jgi:hypothetical protein
MPGSHALPGKPACLYYTYYSHPAPASLPQQSNSLPATLPGHPSLPVRPNHSQASTAQHSTAQHSAALPSPAQHSPRSHLRLELAKHSAGGDVHELDALIVSPCRQNEA